MNVSIQLELASGQNYVGSVIKQCYEDDEDLSDDEDPNLVFGVTTVVGLDKSMGIECIDQINNFLLEKGKKNAKDHVVKAFIDALENEHVGLLINERFVNIPAQISLPLFESLELELNRAVAKKKPFNFSSIILISKFYRKVDGNGAVVEDILSNLEEEAFGPFVTASFDYSVENEADSGMDGNWEEDDSELVPFRKVSLIDVKKLPEVTAAIKELLQ